MKGAIEILQEISDRYGVNWDKASCIYIMADYIDNQQAADAFRDHCILVAESDIAGEDDDLDGLTWPKEEGEDE